MDDDRLPADPDNGVGPSDDGDGREAAKDWDMRLEHNARSDFTFTPADGVAAAIDRLSGSRPGDYDWPSGSPPNPRLRVFRVPPFDDDSFVLVIDRAAGVPKLTDSGLKAMADLCGARGVLVFDGPVDLDGGEL